MDLDASLDNVACLLGRSRDLLDQRPQGDVAPLALVERGWADWLMNLDDEILEVLESEGIEARWPSSTPETLAAFVDSLRDAIHVPALPPLPAPPAPATPAPLPAIAWNPGSPEPVPPAARRPRRAETPSKMAQVDAFAERLIPLARGATRVLDVGSGHGHLTRALAARMPLPVIGLERDESRARRARVLTAWASRRAPLGGRCATDAAGGDPEFEVSDVLADGIPVEPGDCVVGLHACGELGDAMVAAVCAQRGHALALVGCCLQKRRADERRPLTARWADDERLVLPKEMLGLSNLVACKRGVECSRSENLEGRGRRLALHHLLEARVGRLPLGAEIAGLNRRAAHLILPELARRACSVRGLPLPSGREISEAERWAKHAYARVRRFALPRNLLGRVLEVFALFDRACFLHSRGFEVQVGTLFPASVSPRNLALLATTRRRRQRQRE